MKSSQLLRKSSSIPSPQRRLSKGFTALFSAALALGMGANSVLAQGPYYPGVPGADNVPYTFAPNGTPITSAPELQMIEGYLQASNKTLVVPPQAGNSAASLAEYKAAVMAAANAISADGDQTIGSVTLSSLAAEVSKYRPVSGSGIPVDQLLGDILGAFAGGVIAGASTTKSADLQELARQAAKADPAGLTTYKFDKIFAPAAAQNSLVTGVGAIAKRALDGAAEGSSSALLPAGIKSIIDAAISSIVTSSATDADTTPERKPLVLALASTVLTSAAATGSPANLDSATAALTAQSGYVDLVPMVTAIRTGVTTTDVNLGAIAQGVLRNATWRTVSNTAGYQAIKTALGDPNATGYSDDLVDSFQVFNTGSPASATTLVSVDGKDPAAVAAAGVVKFSSNPQAGQVVKNVLIAAVPTPADVRIILNRAVGASQTAVVSTGIAGAAVGSGGALPADIAFGAITGAQISAAGSIASTVLTTAGINVGSNPADVGGAAIAAAAAASPTNVTNAYADVAYQIAFALKGAGGNARSTAAVSAMVSAVIAANGGNAVTAPTYIAVVAAYAGNSGVNNAAILLGSTNGANDAAAVTAGTTMINEIRPNGGSPLFNYQAMVKRIGIDGNQTIAKDLALLYGASLSASNDAAGALAAVIAKSSGVAVVTSAADLTQAAISANRSQQTALTIVGEVADYVRTNLGPGTNFQVYLGRKIVEHPTFVPQIATAASVVLPQFSHVVAHTVAYNAPSTAFQSVDTLLIHSKIAFKQSDNVTNFVNDRPAAVAAIAAGLTTGIIENTQLTAVQRTTALTQLATAAVYAAGNGVPFADATAGPATFRQSTGVGSGFTLQKTIGAAGAVTGFVAQMVRPGDHDLAFNSDLAAMLRGMAAPAGQYFLQVAQAAGQAYGWVSGAADSTAPEGGPAAIAIAHAMNLAYNGGSGIDDPAPTSVYSKLLNAVKFGFDEAKGGNIVNGPLAGTLGTPADAKPGAGAAGLRLQGHTGVGSQPFYDHHSAQGQPVSNIFTL